MKKFLTFTLAIIALTVISSCKNTELTDDQYIANIAANKNYKGTFEFDGQKYQLLAVFLNVNGIKTFAMDDFEGDLHLSKDAGTWDVKNGTITLNSTDAPAIKYEGTLKNSGDKMNLTSGKISYSLEKVVLK